MDATLVLVFKVDKVRKLTYYRRRVRIYEIKNICPRYTPLKCTTDNAKITLNIVQYKREFVKPFNAFVETLQGKACHQLLEQVNISLGSRSLVTFNESRPLFKLNHNSRITHKVLLTFYYQKKN